MRDWKKQPLFAKITHRTRGFPMKGKIRTRCISYIKGLRSHSKLATKVKKLGKGWHAWIPQRVHFSDWLSQKFVLGYTDAQMYQGGKTLCLCSEMSLLRTLNHSILGKPSVLPVKLQHITLLVILSSLPGHWHILPRKDVERFCGSTLAAFSIFCLAFKSKSNGALSVALDRRNFMPTWSHGYELQ